MFFFFANNFLQKRVKEARVVSWCSTRHAAFLRFGMRHGIRFYLYVDLT